MVIFLFLDELHDFRGFLLLLAHEVGVDLCGADVLVGEHLADGVDVGTSGNHEGCVGVAEAVECDVFVDTGRLDPGFESAVDEVAVKAFEHLAFAGLATEAECLVADWNKSLGIGLFCFDADALAALLVVLNVAPLELQDVAQTKAREAGEKGSGLEYGIVAV